MRSSIAGIFCCATQQVVLEKDGDRLGCAIDGSIYEKTLDCVWVKEEEAEKCRDIDWCLLVTAQEQGRIGLKIPLHS